MNLDWGADCRNKLYQNVSGDGFAVIETESGWLLTVIDGLGGGEAAALPTRLALEVLHAHPTRPLKELIERCHAALHGTRGAVIGLLRLESATHRASYVGVGNIGIHVVSQRVIKPISKSGILGHSKLPTLLEMNYTFNLGDLFVLYSDGISTRVISDTSLTQPNDNLSQMAADLLERYGKTSDDVTILLARPN